MYSSSCPFMLSIHCYFPHKTVKGMLWAHLWRSLEKQKFYVNIYDWIFFLNLCLKWITVRHNSPSPKEKSSCLIFLPLESLKFYLYRQTIPGHPDASFSWSVSSNWYNTSRGQYDHPVPSMGEKHCFPWKCLNLLYSGELQV